MIEILFDGLTGAELLCLADAEFSARIPADSPLVFRAGSTEILVVFSSSERRLVVELTEIEPGGEGVLPAMWRLAGQLALRLLALEVQWLVHPAGRGEPQLELERILKSRGFEVREIPGKGQVYHYSYDLSPPG